MSDDDLTEIAATPYLRLVQRGRWAFVQRQNASGVVLIVAVTPEKKLLLIEQYRPPLDAPCIEYPAGLAGDSAADQGELLARAAKRELIEETGYDAAEFEELFCGPVSAGLTDETVTFFLARELNRLHAGGGVDGENITVHEVPLGEVHAWLAAKMQSGCQVGVRIYAGLYFLQRAGYAIA